MTQNDKFIVWFGVSLVIKTIQNDKSFVSFGFYRETIMKIIFCFRLTGISLTQLTLGFFCSEFISI